MTLLLLILGVAVATGAWNIRRLSSLHHRRRVRRAQRSPHYKYFLAEAHDRARRNGGDQ